METRGQKIQFILESIMEFEGAEANQEYYESLSDVELDKQVAWYEYLWTK